MRQPDFMSTRVFWQRLAIILVLIPGVAVFAALFPQFALPIAILALLALLADRVRLGYAMRDLAERISHGDLGAKLEVGSGAWGALCHAVNNLLQRQRLQQRAQVLLPAIPARALQALAADHLPASGVTRPVTVLIIGVASSSHAADASPDQIAELRALAVAAQQQSEQHNALLDHIGNALLLAFGAFEEQPLAVSLRSALTAAQVLRQAWANATPRGTLAISLAGGNAVAAVLPGVGYTVLGYPVDQAIRLQHLAVACPEYALLCSEDAYATLRRLGSAAWLPTDLRLFQPGRPAQGVYALLF